jgi:hypothetical protein
MILNVILNYCNMTVAITFNVLELHWKNIIITTIATDSYNISDFELQAIQ